MTELYIENQLVVLPENTSFTFIEDNSLFNKGEKATYDITISLENPINARIYKYANRLNIDGKIKKGRQAILKVDNRVRMIGTEIILEKTNTYVKIQLVSEFNFLKGGERLLRDMDLGKVTDFDKLTSTQRDWLIEENWKKTYPDIDYHVLPFTTKENPEESEIGNFCTFYGFPQSQTTQAIWTNFSRIAIQPYLCAILKRIIEALGYKFEYNALAEHPVFKNLYIVNGYITLEYAKTLPNWTINEFLSKIELQYNGVFLINSFDKKVRFLFRHQADELSQELGIERTTLEVVDDYVQSIDDENVLTVYGANIGYNLDEFEVNKFASISKYARDSIVDYLLESASGLEKCAANPSLIKHPNRLKISITGMWSYSDFIIVNDGSTEYLQKIDYFAPLFQNEETEELDHEFDIIPATMTYYESKVRGGRGVSGSIWIQLPITPDHDPVQLMNDENDLGSLQEIIEGSNSENNKSSSKMRLAIYDGMKDVDWATKTDEFKPLVNRFPLSYVESLAVYFPQSKKLRYFTDNIINPFRFTYLNQEIYSKGKVIDTTEPHKFSFKEPQNFDIRGVFNINNRDYVCAKVERTTNINGFDELATGYFYAKM